LAVAQRLPTGVVLFSTARVQTTSRAQEPVEVFFTEHRRRVSMKVARKVTSLLVVMAASLFTVAACSRSDNGNQAGTPPAVETPGSSSMPATGSQPPTDATNPAENTPGGQPAPAGQ
jgi:hypothetical protein